MLKIGNNGFCRLFNPEGGAENLMPMIVLPAHGLDDTTAQVKWLLLPHKQIAVSSSVPSRYARFSPRHFLRRQGAAG
ncbi:MAG TPA: hypothetical protein PKW99_08445 [Thauera sp.]|nr:hypothetical protein [Thauera sp.]